MNENITKILKILPEKPGVYIMRDKHGKIIYVGKAIILKNRVRSYFRRTEKQAVKVQALVARVCDIETIVTANEMEALILECNLIKQYRPHYNISLKDDKSYPYLKVALSEPFPRIYVTRRQVKDGSRYYGPYADAGALHTTVKLIRNMFPLRTCRNLNAARPCLQYHLKRCLAPCAGLVSKEDYDLMINAVQLLMDGKTTDLERTLKNKMYAASEACAFEEAGRYRDLLFALEKLKERQKVVTEGGDQDALGIAHDATGFCVQVFLVRGGKLVGRENYFLNAQEGDAPKEVLTAFLKQYYSGADYIPKELLLSVLPEEAEARLIGQWLTEKAGHKVELIAPQRGLKHGLIQMAEDNGIKNLQERLRKGQISIKTAEEAAAELQEALELVEPLERMDCFDISHTQGSETVASMVVFRNGAPSKKDYRKYKIQSAEGKPDDFKSMQEVVYRRYSKGENLPNLVVIDGGKGQLSSALEVIRGLGLYEVPVIGLAKREEEIFIEGSSESILLSRNSAALHLIQHIRDEAHRFAITFHRKLRAKRNLVSVLDHIEGIGPKRRQALWKQFNSLEAMKAATVEAIVAVDGMNRPSAQRLYDFFHADLVTKKEQLK